MFLKVSLLQPTLHCQYIQLQFYASKQKEDVKFQVLTAAIMKMAVFWADAPPDD
jgi:hypothetical protein